MMNSFTSNYHDESTEAGFQFTFYCDICGDGYKTTFVESAFYRQGASLRKLGEGANILGSVLGGAASNLGWNLSRGSDLMSDRFESASPEWQKEHDLAFERAMNEAKQHFHRCHGCQRWVCDSCYNEEDGMCVECAPRESVAVTKARMEARENNLHEAASTATVWTGDLKEKKTIICPACGKPTGEGKFCNNCGASLALNVCPACGAQMAQGVKFCSECGSPMGAPKPAAPTECPNCGSKLEPGAKFCGECGTKIG